MLKFAFVYFIILLITGVSCKRDKEMNLHHGSRKYNVKEIRTSELVDLNFDGIFNQDLLQELSWMKKNPVFIDFDKEYLNIIWMEPRINKGAIGLLPTAYDEGLVIDWLPVQNPYYFSFDNEGNIQPTQSLENNNYSFIFPQHVLLHPNGDIYFSTQQLILTTTGIKTMNIDCLYSLDTEYAK